MTVALNGFGFWFHKLVVSKCFNMISESGFVNHVRIGLLKLDVRVDIKVVFEFYISKVFGLCNVYMHLDNVIL